MFQYRATLLMSVSALMLLSVPAATRAQNTASAPITIVRRPGHEDGMAQMMVKGKVRKISPHAVEAWTVRGGGRRADHRPAAGEGQDSQAISIALFRSGERAQAAVGHSADERGAGGGDGREGQRVGLRPQRDGYHDRQAGHCRGRRPGHSRDAGRCILPSDARRFAEFSGGRRNRVAPLGVLLGTARPDIYAPPESTQLSPRLLQVFPDGTALAMSREGTIQRATWQTDGQVLQMRSLHEKVVYSVPW